MVDKHTLFETARHTHYKTYGWRKSVSNLNMEHPKLDGGQAHTC